MLTYEGYIELQIELVYLAVIAFFLFVRLLYLLFNVDIFAPFENLFCSIFMGGMMDALKRATEKPEDPAAVAAAAKNHPGIKPKEE
jgi:hypothetical protein